MRAFILALVAIVGCTTTSSMPDISTIGTIESIEYNVKDGPFMIIRLDDHREAVAGRKVFVFNQESRKRVWGKAKVGEKGHISYNTCDGYHYQLLVDWIPITDVTEKQ